MALLSQAELPHFPACRHQLLMLSLQWCVVSAPGQNPRWSDPYTVPVVPVRLHMSRNLLVQCKSGIFATNAPCLRLNLMATFGPGLVVRRPVMT